MTVVADADTGVSADRGERLPCISDAQANRVVATGEEAAEARAKGIFPANERPAAVPIMLASAIPISKKRSGNFFTKSSVLVDFAEIGFQDDDFRICFTEFCECFSESLSSGFTHELFALPGVSFRSSSFAFAASSGFGARRASRFDFP